MITLRNLLFKEVKKKPKIYYKSFETNTLIALSATIKIKKILFLKKRIIYADIPYPYSLNFKKYIIDQIKKNEKIQNNRDWEMVELSEKNSNKFFLGINIFSLCDKKYKLFFSNSSNKKVKILNKFTNSLAAFNKNFNFSFVYTEDDL